MDLREERCDMPVITQGRKQFIVPLDILFGWNRYKKENPDGKIIMYKDEEKILEVCPDKIISGNTHFIKGRKRIWI